MPFLLWVQVGGTALQRAAFTASYLYQSSVAANASDFHCRGWFCAASPQALNFA